MGLVGTISSGQADVTLVPDQAFADKVSDTASATRAALSAGSGVARFIARAKAGATLKVVALGDSILGGTGATLGVNDAVTKVRDALAAQFPAATITQSNRALSGSTTATIAITGNLASAITDAGDLYIIGLGRNDVTVDALGGAPAQGYARERSLRYFEVMIRTIRASVPQADILLVTENPPTTYATDGNMRTYQDGVRNLAAAYGCELADTYTAYGTSGYEALLSDATHPSVAGHQLYADTIMDRIPASVVGTGTARATLAKGVRDAENVDTTVGSNGWTVANGSAPPSNYTQTGAGWNGSYPRSTTGVGDYMEWTFTGTDFGIRVDHSAGAAPVVDILVDGVPTFTNQSLAALPSAFQLYQFLATGLSNTQHVVKIVCKSGTLTWYQAAWLAGAPAVNLYGEPGGLRRMKPGRYYTQPRLAVATVCFLNSGDAYTVPLWIPKETALDRLAVDVTQAVASSTLTLGIYDSDEYDQPRNRLTQTSALDTTTTGWKEATLTGVTLQKGWHWLSLLALGGFAANALRVRGSDLPSPVVTTSSASLAAVLNGYLDAGEAALPTPWVSTVATAISPLLVVRAA